MVYKRGKKIELRKRKDTEKEKKKKAWKKKKKDFKETFENFRLTVAIFLLIGANFLFIISIVIQSFATMGTTGSIKPSSYEVPQLEKPQKILTVEVLNGCGVLGTAKELTDYLRQRNIDVVYYGNFESWELSETLVIDRRDHDLVNAKIIGKVIGVEQNRMFPQISPQRQLDVTIIIGKNYKQLKAF
ncbi:MAG: LytR C-terminal domain-containing protein [bacterium]|nr:MAG: LytR C-terminal domain-containing protein [bacterium]